MPVMDKQWLVARPITPEANRSLAAYPPIFRQILFNRGLQTFEAAESFLHARPAGDDAPYGLLGMQQAVARICQAISRQEQIAVYGDYDVDGVTATALLTLALRSAGAQVREYIPNRFDEGYGLNKDALDFLKEAGVGLVITVDCGVRSIPEVEHGRRLGLDMIVTDHHHPAADLPPATAIINPKQSGCSYSYKELAGVGLAYKLVTALFSELGMPASAAEVYLDLVALGTVADIAPLDGENRCLVSAGLKRIRYTERQGIASLIGSAGIGSRPVTASDIGFILGPRLNAAGRLDSALAALQLLLSDNLLQAGMLAQQLEIQNRERQEITRQIQARAEELAIAADPQAVLLFAVDPDFNSGVVGLAASRLMDHYYRPAVVGCRGEEFTRASCRSIPEFHITDALDQCADLLEHHGGHAAAAGFTIRNENLPLLFARLTALAQEKLGGRELLPVLKADLELPLSQLHPDLLPLMELLEPTGAKNPTPTFVSRGLQVKQSRTVGKDSLHLKLTLADHLITYDAIAFRKGHLHENMPPRVDILYRFETNEFNGRKSLQLNIQDIKPS